MPILLSVEPMGGLVQQGACTGPPLADGQLTTVQAGIAAAAPGDVVCVPAGAWTWTAGLTISKQITLKGAGIGQTIITQGSPGTFELITWTPQAGGLNRITGLEFRAAATVTGTWHLLVVHGVQKQVRIDHCRFEPITGIYALTIYDGVRGVADHNVFDLSRQTALVGGIQVFHNTWTGSLDPLVNSHGDLSWSLPDSFGTDEAWYWEDNTITFDNTGKPTGLHHVDTNDGWSGSRVVARFNTVKNTIISAGHGTESGGRDRGRRQQECYRNISNFDCLTCGGNGTDHGIAPVYGGRSGALMYWENTVTAQNNSDVGSVFTVDIYRAKIPEINPTQTIWIYCGERVVTSLTTTGVMTTATQNGIAQAVVGYELKHTQVRISGATGPDAAIYNGVHPVNFLTSNTVATIGLPSVPVADAVGTLRLTSPWDGNTLPGGYPCLDQTGYGQADLFNDSIIPGPPYEWPHQVLTPNLYWANTYNSAPANTVTVTGVGVDGNPLCVLNRELLTDGPTSVIRSGPFVAMPTPSCVEGNLYWATDVGSWNTKSGGQQGRLYKCVGGAWTPWYGRNNATGEPLQYPHPVTLLI